MSFFLAFTVGWRVGEVGEGYIHESCNGSCRLWHQSLWNVMLAICFDQIQCKKWVQTKITGHDCAVAPDASIVVKIDFIFQCTLIIINRHWLYLGNALAHGTFQQHIFRTRTAHQEEALELLVVGHFNSIIPSELARVLINTFQWFLYIVKEWRVSHAGRFEHF